MKLSIILILFPLFLVISAIALSFDKQITLHQAFPKNRTFTVLVSKGHFFVGKSFGRASFALPRFGMEDFESGYPYFIGKSSREPGRMWLLKEGSNKSPPTGFLFPTWVFFGFGFLISTLLFTAHYRTKRRSQGA